MVNVLRLYGWLFRLIERLLGYLLLLLILLFGLNYSTVPTGIQWRAISLLVKDHTFDYVTWEVNALAVKAQQELYGLHPFMTEPDRSQYVRQYLTDLATAQQLEAQVNAIYTDPAVTDPQAESAELRVQRDALRADFRDRQPLVESILEGQVSAVLVDEGFGLLGQVLPPLSMHFTPLPNLLAVSPRDEIKIDVNLNIDPLPIDEIAALEALIDKQEDVSSLVIPLGGIALYPAMIFETASLQYAVEVFAHEWLHHYLFAFPLGQDFDFSGESRIINETTANIFGKVISPLVIARYYPELAHTPTTQLVSAPQQADAPFDFGAEMDQTRRRVDDLLADGKVAEAEVYMEERRQLFVENGWSIRKLNQAYFAFYGGYQSGAPGAGGSDPIGPSVQTILDLSPSIHDWIVTMRTITTRTELLNTLESLQSGVGF